MNSNNNEIINNGSWQWKYGCNEWRSNNNNENNNNNEIMSSA
jgi:hypothetical protein